MSYDKTIQKFADQLGFTRKSNQIHGDFNGYWFTLTPDQSSKYRFSFSTDRGKEKILTSLDYSGEGKEAALRAYLDSVRKKHHFTYKLQSPGALVIQTGTALTTKRTIQKIEKLLKELSDHFPSLGLENTCYNCGATGRHAAYRAGVMTAEVCPSCITELETLYAQEKETLLVSGSYVSGAVGAVLGALLGSIVWLVFSYLGFVAALAGFAIAYAASYGYRLFKGKVGKGMPAILVLSVIFAIFVANTLEIAVSLTSYEIGLSPLDAFLIAPRAFFDTELFHVGQVWLGMGLGLVFGAMGSYKIIRESMDHAAFKNYEIEKL